MLYVPQMNFVSTSILEHECMEKKSELHKGNLKRFSYLGQPRNFSFPNQILLCIKHSFAKKWENCLHVPSFPKGHVWICPFMSQTVILGLFSTNFQLENKSLHLPWIRIYTAYVLESSLSRGLFLWMVQHKSRFRNLKRVDGTTQEFVRFPVCKF